MNILAAVLARYRARRAPVTPPTTPSVTPSSADLNRQWHKDRAKARGGGTGHPGQAGQSQPGERPWGGIGGDGLGG
ncbi:hypothetical protein [Marmoricola sp. URHB0036]|uniref:hypothetical protein n=1 Tax=Marmoricola sp. URHB0036 TaxID=1298863 RepID=UPI0012DE0296|nr:hypothetical protein [Marmoricola sp. URHB0036]